VSLWSRWAAFLARREGAESLALARIIAGATVVKSFIGVAASGVARAGWVDVDYGGIRRLDPSWVAWFGGLTPTNVTALLAIGIGGAALMAAGAFTRATSVVTFIVFRTLAVVNPVMRDSSDRLLISVLFLLMLSEAGRALSVDAWLRKSRGNTPHPEKTGDVPAWPRYVAVLQLVVMYSMTAAQKVSSGWVPGGPLDALWYILEAPSWQRFSMRWVAPFFPVTQAMTLLIWAFELSAPLFLLSVIAEEIRPRGGRVRCFLRKIRFRSVYLAGGVVLHVGIAVFMDIQQFLGGVIALYACCIPPGVWRAIGARLERLRVAGRKWT
jgi:hypothetical protein